MKKNFRKRIMLVYMSMLMIISVFSSTCMGATYNTYREQFGSPDADEQNPYSATGEIGYTYTEFGWSGGNAGVNTTEDASARYYVNTSDSGVNGIANFTLNTSYAYEYFDFSFKYLNTWSTNHNHSSIAFKIRGNSGVAITLQVYGANTSQPGKTNRLVLLDRNNVVRANVSITQNKWYNVRVDPDWDSWDNDVTVTVYDVDGASYIVNVASNLGLGSNTKLTEFEIEDISNEGVCVLVDNLLLYQVIRLPAETQTNMILGYAIPILYASAMLVTIVGLALTGNLDAKSLITMVLITIIGVVALQIIVAI